MSISAVLLLLAIIGVLVFVHEAGHFIVAKVFGVGITRFSLGFGPRLIGKKIGMTDYRVSLVPLGGYVSFVDDEKGSENFDKRLFLSNQGVLRRIAIVFAGPFLNFILAFFIFVGVSYFSGTDKILASVNYVPPGTAAYKAGIMAGDLILRIDDKKVSDWKDIHEYINMNPGKEVKILVLRGGEEISFRLVPDKEKVEKIGYIYHIGAEPDIIRGSKYEAGKSVANGAGEVAHNIGLTLKGFGKMIIGDISPKNMSGPIGIGNMAEEIALIGFAALLSFIAFLSVSLGVLNLLPIPCLDGGHILFYSIEAVRGYPVNGKLTKILNHAGMYFLLFLMIFIVYNDMSKIIWGV